MVFESTPQTTGIDSRYLGEGFRHEPDFRDGTATFEVVSETPGAADVTIPAATPAKQPAKPNLDYVFDDPAHGEPGRDRMLVHGLWEVVLALAVGGVGILLHQAAPAALSGNGLRDLALAGATLGLITAGAALSLRAGVPNLAIGPVAVAASIYYAQHSGSGLVQPLLVVIGLCAAAGLVQGLFVVGLHVPAWAAGLGAGAAVLIWVNRYPGGADLTGGAYDPAPHAYYWFGGFAVASVVAGLVCLVPAIRRASGRFRAVADPAQRRGLVAALVALGATVVSSILAGLAGVLGVSLAGSVGVGDGLSLTAIAVGAALLGGTSAYGRRGGIFGTLLAVALLTVVTAYTQATHRSWSDLLLAAVAILTGLAVTRLVERFGRPAPARDDDEDEDWAPRVHAITPAARAWPAPAVPATPAAGGLWASDDAWGSTDRR